MQITPSIPGGSPGNEHGGGAGHDHGQRICEKGPSHQIQSLLWGLSRIRNTRSQGNPILLSFTVSPTSPCEVKGGEVNNSIAIDAKRILLRYGAPIAVLDKVNETDRIEFARAIARTTLADREPRLRELLTERGYIDED